MNVWMRRGVLGFAVGVMLVAWSGVGQGQAKDPADGTWKLNLAKSKFSPGPAPKEVTATIEAAGPGRKIEVSGTAADGTAAKWGYSGNFDGKDVRVTGTNPDADIVVLKRISPNATRTTYKKDGKRTLVSGLSVAADGKTMTVAQTGVNAKGQTVKNTMVFDRQ